MRENRRPSGARHAYVLGQERFDWRPSRWRNISIIRHPLTHREPHQETRMRDYVTFVYGFNLMYAETLVQDLSAEQMVQQPNGVINHPAWSLGHLVVSSNSLGSALGLESSLPEGVGQDIRHRWDTVVRPVCLSVERRDPRRAQGAALAQHKRAEERRPCVVGQAPPERKHTEVLSDTRRHDHVLDDGPRNGPPGTDRGLAAVPWDWDRRRGSRTYLIRPRHAPRRPAGQAGKREHAGCD